MLLGYIQLGILSVFNEYKVEQSMAFLSLLQKKIGWYPVSRIGWVVTGVYLALLLYVVIAINRDLYRTDISLFYGSIIISGIILCILMWARLRGEKPFKR